MFNQKELGCTAPDFLSSWLQRQPECKCPLQVRWAGDRCSVCDSDVDFDTDQLVSCDACGLTVHQSCYGVAELPGVDDMWLCRACELKARPGTNPAYHTLPCLPGPTDPSAPSRCAGGGRSGAAVLPVPGERRRAEAGGGGRALVPRDVHAVGARGDRGRHVHHGARVARALHRARPLGAHVLLLQVRPRVARSKCSETEL